MVTRFLERVGDSMARFLGENRQDGQETLVAEDALRLWRIIAPERYPLLGAHTAYFGFDYESLSGLAEPLTPQMKGIQRILKGYAVADGGDGLFLGQLILHPYFNPEGKLRKPLIGEESFVLDISKLPPPQFPSGGARPVLRVNEVSNRADLVHRYWDEKYGAVERRIGSNCPEVRVYSLDGSQPYAPRGRECLIKWDLVGFDEEGEACLWENRDDPDFIFSQMIRGTLFKAPVDRWQREFARRLVYALINSLGEISREEMIERDRVIQDILKSEAE